MTNGQRDHDDVSIIETLYDGLQERLLFYRVYNNIERIDQFDSDVSQDARNRFTPPLFWYSPPVPMIRIQVSYAFLVLHYSSVIPYFVFGPAHRVVYVVCCFHLFVCI
jgi:hypothetical protein